MDLIKIQEILKKEPVFRLKQIKKAIFQDLIENWDEVFTLPQDLRQKLRDCYPISESKSKLKPEKILTSKDSQTIKVLFELKDGFKIESVLMKHEDGRRTVCTSSQIGCEMGCQFCATGQQGFKRNLTSSEIIEQILFFARLLKKNKEKITNVVFMGMGEPFLNYDNVLEAIKILNDKDGFNLGSRHISISTCGITEGIKKLAEEKLQINLAISLHAPNNALRTKIMPINRTYSIEKILAAVDDYIKKTKRRVMFEYLMIDEVNDSPKEAIELTKLLKKPLFLSEAKKQGSTEGGFLEYTKCSRFLPKARFLYFVNLISFNPVGHSKFKPSSGWKIKKFKEILEKGGIVVTQRYRFGREIKAACGQLAGTPSEALLVRRSFSEGGAKEGGQLAGKHYL